MVKKYDRKLVLENGTEYFGYGFGVINNKVTELAFDTSMIGYEEVVSDPAYLGQTVVMTYPLIGNYGIAEEDLVTKAPMIGGFVVRKYNNSPSNFRYTKTLSEIMEENGIAGIYGVDTRKLTAFLRENGSCKAIIVDIETDTKDALDAINNYNTVVDLSEVSCKKCWYSRTPNPKYNVVAIDCGITYGAVRLLNERGCNVSVVPYNVTLAEIEKMKPDGVYISSGPGNPEDFSEITELIKELRGKYPMVAVGLGMQLLCLSYGAKTYKLKVGHHGGNYPIKNTQNGEVEITVQNHDYAVCEDSLKDTDLTVTYKNILDGSVEAVECVKDSVIGTQYYLDDSEGPNKRTSVIDRFQNLMKEGKRNA